MKLTGWHEDHQKPVRDGWYHVSMDYGEIFYRLFWNNSAKEWGAFDCGHWYESSHQAWHWQGVAKRRKK